MTTNNAADSVFIIVNLFLIAAVAVLLVGQLIVWLIVTFISKKKKNLFISDSKIYETLLAKEKYDGTIKKVTVTAKFNNYSQKNNCLKLKTNDFNEKTIWNCYQNLLSILAWKWKKNHRKTHLTLIISTIIFYLGAVMAIVCALIYYLNVKQDKITTINTTALSIVSFTTMMTIVLSWLVWTMTYEKVRKELIALVSSLEKPKLTKIINRISAYKTLVPSSELLL